MNIQEKLKKAGLTGNEAKVYIELTKRGQLSANQIAKNISLDRTLTYTILNHLIEKGQVSYSIKQNRKFFSASSPENLMNPVKEKEVIISELIQELQKIKSEKQSETEINIYEGVEGIRSLLKIALKHKETLSFGGTGRIFEQLYESHAIAKQTNKQKIKLKVILHPKKISKDFLQHKNIQIRTLNIESESTTSIFGDYVSIHLIKEKPLIILIKNEHIAQSYKNYFEYLWKTAKNQPK